MAQAWIWQLVSVALVAGFVLWIGLRVRRAGCGLAAASLAAAYLLMAAVVRLWVTDLPAAALLAPLALPYIWCGIAALFWCPCRLHLTRTGIDTTGSDPRLAALFLSQLGLYPGVVLCRPLTGSHSLIFYLLRPSLTILCALALAVAYTRLLTGSPLLRWRWAVLPAILIPLGFTLVGNGLLSRG